MLLSGATEPHEIRLARRSPVHTCARIEMRPRYRGRLCVGKNMHGYELLMNWDRRRVFSLVEDLRLLRGDPSCSDRMAEWIGRGEWKVRWENRKGVRFQTSTLLGFLSLPTPAARHNCRWLLL